MNRYWLFAILILAATLRLYGLDRGDTVNDEVFYGFRAIGMLDFDKAETQKTPLEWYDPRHTGGQADIPWWTKLSFHDHPPLVFLIQNIFMKVLGDERWVMRLPSAIFGVASVYLIYRLGWLLFSESAGLFGAALVAVTLNNVYINRTGMQEAYVIFFMLLASYLFLKNYFIWTGVVLGFGLLTKYNTFILVPIFLSYLAIFKREYLWNKKLWAGATIAILIASPVIIYNVMMYWERGHFDFQISHALGQVPEEWREAPGKEIGTLGERIKNFVPRLIASNSWLFLGLFAVSLFFLRNAFLFLVFSFLFLLLLLIGPSYRFLTMLTPWMALVLGGLTAKWRLNRLWVGLLLPILLFEIFYTYNNQIAYYPKGPEPWLSSKIRYENYNWGYNALDDYLRQELEGKMPSLTFETRYQFLKDVQDRYLEKAEARGLEPYPALITYYGNFDEGARLWVFDRRHVYRAWPIITLDTYFQYLRENGPARLPDGQDYYKKVGFKNYYFIQSANIVPSPEFSRLVRGLEPILLKNPRGDTAFKVFKLN